MFDTVLIANRGAIATRIIRTLKKMGIRSVAVYNEADYQSLHVQQADTAISLGAGSAADTYLNIAKILDAAKQTGAQAVHPGYGFLSENTEFVGLCEQAGLTFIGPTTEQMRLFGLKHVAREAAEQADVPLVPGSPLLSELADALVWAKDVGYPIMLKSTAGGGGIGMQVCHSESQLQQAWDSVKRLSANYFSNDGVFLEKYIADARHIEVQIFGDGAGTAVAFGERDCSAQRRNQKVIEETPAPNLSEAVRADLCATAQRLMASVNYRNAGTVEFIFDAKENKFYFLEVNTRLQVEHGVTEQVWSVDLVEWMIKQAAGELGDIQALHGQCKPAGHAIQVRVYAEDPQQDFRPSAGLLSEVAWPTEAIFAAPSTSELRIDHWIESGVEVPALFDPMLAKVIVHSENREQALADLNTSLANSAIYGIETNIDYVREILATNTCKNGQLLTRSLAEFTFNAHTFTVLNGGTQTTVQDYPGRTGLWHVGVPPSGPMDNLNFRLANQLVGNQSEAAGLEITLNGPSLHFNTAAHIAVTGAEVPVLLDGVAVDMYQSIAVSAGQTLEIGQAKGNGARAYLAIAGGIQCPEYLGSKSTFTLGQFGGHVGRALRPGDVLKLLPLDSEQKITARQIAQADRPEIGDTWTIHVIYGPHGAPDFFTDKDIQTFFDAEWEVHYNSSRTGVRLIGPKPEWARDTGGEAGLHPSNIHDNAYAFGTVDFTGDMPVILGPDGPSLGGFVCPATIIQADLWKLGQLKAGAKIKFVAVTYEQAVQLEAAQHWQVSQLAISEKPITSAGLPSPILKKSSLLGEDVVYRLAGDHFLLVELGPLELDIARRFKVHALMLWMQENPFTGMRELTPGIRSLQVHYDSQQHAVECVIEHIERGIQTLLQADDLKVPARIVHLPLSWDDEACKLAIEKYTQSVRPGAPWCPSNLEFIRRINGLDSIEQVKEIVFNAAYLVMGLGDVYLGAPVATPLDPRHRLVTTKYNPARTWTAENSVGIGGAYMCVYGMEGPGGYQFVGRTLQMWNRYRQTNVFENPWLLQFFDQIRFYEVSSEELHVIRRDFPLGKYPIKIENTTFSLADYQQYLSDNSATIERFQTTREQAFEQELNQWRADGQLTFEQADAGPEDNDASTPPEGAVGVDSPVSGSVWQVLKREGDYVEKGEVLMVLESMKMEIDVHATCAGKVIKTHKQQGQAVTAGQTLFWIAEQSEA
ncbi:urea carboxylase [Saccharophagus degradans]|uniref:urea carboxylase n=1 Tax=Saccharophagus degradans TaxID=86304 RepID=UPI002477D10F|nr:urea carboxylase [Saccharophagus degradans]WGO97437.1 urea carboxylase [Saccharophagus degradans]